MYLLTSASYTVHTRATDNLDSFIIFQNCDTGTINRPTSAFIVNFCCYIFIFFASMQRSAKVNKMREFGSHCFLDGWHRTWLASGWETSDRTRLACFHFQMIYLFVLSVTVVMLVVHDQYFTYAEANVLLFSSCPTANVQRGREIKTETDMYAVVWRTRSVFGISYPLSLFAWVQKQ